MAKFIELHWLPGEGHEPIQIIQSVAEISRVYQTKDGNAAIMWQNPLVQQKDLHFLVAESYEEVKRMLIGAEEQKASVVQCKDCLYWQDNNGGYPNKNCRWREDETPDADDFCSYGERKDGKGWLN